MKRTLLFTIIALLIVACETKTNSKASNRPQENTTVSADLSMVKTITLPVKGMTCGGCENSVVKSVKKLDGIAEVTASHEKENAVVKFDTTLTDIEQVKEAITQAGYTIE